MSTGTHLRGWHLCGLEAFFYHKMLFHKCCMRAAFYLNMKKTSINLGAKDQK